MGTTGFPGGITSPSLGGVIAGRVIFAGNRAGLPSSNGGDPGHPFSTTNGALAKAQSNRGDVIRLVPGTLSSLATADALSNLVAGTTIEGIGVGDERPILRWTAAASSLLLDVAGVTLRNLRLQLAGDPAGTTALTVAAPITVSAAGCTIENCDIDAGVDADQLATIPITTTAGANRFVFRDNVVRCGALASGTTFLRLNGCDGATLLRNRIVYSTSSAAIGVVQGLTVAPTNFYSEDNYYENNLSTSTAAFTGMVGMTGICKNDRWRIWGANLAFVTTSGLLGFFGCEGINAISDGTPEKGFLFGTTSG